MKKLIIGLTGGIACGKSTVEKLFAQLDIIIVDADQVARDVVTSRQPALQKIIRHFGTNILTNEGTLNRRKLRDIIFADSQQRHWLESLLHPLIRKLMQQQALQATSPYCLLAIPLLIETLPNPFIDRILVINCDQTLQKQFLQQRDQLSPIAIDKVLNSQVTNEQRLHHADDVINNQGDINNLTEQIEKLHNFYMGLI
ncbi:MAG: dephospho-CoA kinase [Gammaproteobacteria bacterium]|nr:dephospho-CoA kinase [Gammaproteobacteria bacterium]